ncbi:P-type conjugative transfer protein TrbJ [Duganella callida]|uniref:P-type conjugative transfer protein TrbJ n=1 Tax=Duganella callida TaxID=2561932 RepID=A0A4Y9SRN3_9BURK|nr:P-type conjugative transfer protein TrbJ [Duganella callida]TFW28147.1 P-type conjugative transfer protein TrbJ [Duganella callida]
MTIKQSNFGTIGRLSIAVSIALSCVSANAGSVAGFGGSTEITQILNNIELIQQSAQMYQQVQNTITQIQHSQQQLKNLIAAPQMVWGQAQAELQQVAQLVAQGQALGYALGNVDQQFATKYPGYSATAPGRNLQQASRTWVQTSLDSLRASLNAAGLQSNQFANEQAAMDSIQGIAAGSPGSLQVAQAGVMVAGQQVQQLQKLRQLFMTQMQAQNSFLAGQAQAQSDKAETTGQFLRQGNGTVRQPGQSGFQSF